MAALQIATDVAMIAAQESQKVAGRPPASSNIWSPFLIPTSASDGEGLSLEAAPSPFTSASGRTARRKRLQPRPRP